MTPDGKQTVSENEAAGLFLVGLLRDVQQAWPSIATALQEFAIPDAFDPEDKEAAFEFALAVVAVQIQAIPKLFPGEQADRIMKHCLECMCGPDLGSYPKLALEEYQSAWDRDAEFLEPPVYGVASVLYDKLECSSTCQVGSTTYKDPVLLTALAHSIISVGGSRWKDLALSHEIVP